MTVLSPSMSIDDLELAFLKESYAEGYGKRGKAVVQRNILDNGGCRINAGFGAWNGGGLNVVSSAHNPAGGPRGFGSYKVTWTTGAQNSGGPQMLRNGGKFYSLKQNVQYTYAVKVQSNKNLGIGITKEAWDTDTGGGSQVAGQGATGAVSAAVANDWKLYWVTFINTAVQYNKFSTYLNGSAVPLADGDWVEIAEGVLFEGDISKYNGFFDGTMASDNVFTNEWEGGANASSSIRTATTPILFENWFPNPNAHADDLAKWGVVRGTKSFETSKPISGTRSWRVDSDGSAGAGCAYVFNTSSGYINAVNRFRLNVGETAYFGATLRVPAGQYARVELASTDSPGSTLTQAIGATVAGPAEVFQVVSVTAASAGAAKVQAVVRFGADAAFATNPLGIVGIFDNVHLGKVSFNKRMDSGVSKFTGTDYDSNYVVLDPNASDWGSIEKAFYAKNSGLAPVEQYSLADHKLAFLRNTYTFVAGSPVPNGADITKYGITDLYLNWLYANSGLAPANSYSAPDHELAMYKAKLGL